MSSTLETGSLRAAATTFFLLVVAAVWFVLASARHLPESVASNFGADGVAQAWMGRDQYTLFWVAMLLFLAANFAGISWLVGRVPDALINLPNKEYWLSGERRATAVSYLRVQLYWMGSLTMGFLMVVLWLGYQANLLEEPRLSPSFLWWLFGFLALTAVWVVRLVRTFLLVPSDDR